MWNLLRHLFHHRTRSNRILVIDQDDPDRSNHFELTPFSLVWFMGTLFTLVIAASLMLFFITPLGDLYQSPQANQIREELFAIEQRIEALRDTITARDMQLATLQLALRANLDTTFATSALNNMNMLSSARSGIPFSETWNSYDLITQRSITMAGQERYSFGASPFQNPYLPIDGTPSRSFDLVTSHYGTDFATQANTSFFAAENGVVVTAHWTLEYGYVMAIQHMDGFLSVYKHGGSLAKKKGDYVFKGDLLGTVSDSGILSYGPHLHFEIWKDGIPTDPAIYLPLLY